MSHCSAALHSERLNIEFRHLRFYIAVAEFLHFTKAAQHLHTAQPSLSQQIRKLEHSVGTALLQRTRNNLSLTPAGAVFLHEARLVLAQLDQAVWRAREVGRVTIDELSVGCVWAAEVEILPRLIQQLSRTAPHIKVRLQNLTNSELRAALRRREIDVAFLRWPDREEDGIMHKRVLCEELIAVLPPGHALAQQQSLTLAALAELPYVAPAESEAPELRQVIVSLFANEGITLRTAHEVRNMFCHMTLVRQGLGFCILPSYVRTFLGNDLEYRPLVGRPTIDLHMAWRKDTETGLSQLLRSLPEVTV